MAWHVYESIPIDFGWENLKSVEDTAADIGAMEARARSWSELINEPYPKVAEFVSGWREAQLEAEGAGWEGDFRQQPAVFWLPGPEGAPFVFGFVIKQDNNGTTYIVSPVRLPHLEATVRR